MDSGKVLNFLYTGGPNYMLNTPAVNLRYLGNDIKFVSRFFVDAFNELADKSL